MFLNPPLFGTPKVFVSSTMEDPNDKFRKYIKKFLGKTEKAGKTLGFEVVEFQGHAFPYSNSSKAKVQQETIDAVQTVDLFILLVGKRYGKLYRGRSVVHWEYETAREHDIRTLVFIQQKVWKDYLSGLKKTSLEKRHYRFIAELEKAKLTPFDDPRECARHIQEQVNNLLGAFLRFDRGTTWLWNKTRVADIERAAKEVWVVTPNFYWDLENEEFRDIVTHNLLDRNCIYRYIYPQSPQNNGAVAELKRRYQLRLKRKDHRGNPLDRRLFYLPIEEKSFLCSLEQVLYNPFKKNEHAILVDMLDNTKDSSMVYDIELSEQRRLAFRKQFKRLWNSEVENSERIR